MRLVYAKYEIEIQLRENEVYTLVLEQPVVFTDFLRNLMAQINGMEGELILSEGDQQLSLAKNAVLISNPLMVDSNEKRVLTKLYKELDQNVKNLMYEKYSMISAELLQFMEDMTATVPYQLSTETDLNIMALLKAYDVKIALEENDPLERLIDYLRAFSSICGIRVFVILNLKHFFTEDQVVQLYEFCFYSKIFLINLEGQKNYTLPEERCVIIDKDFCFITPEYC